MPATVEAIRQPRRRESAWCPRACRASLVLSAHPRDLWLTASAQHDHGDGAVRQRQPAAGHAGDLTAHLGTAAPLTSPPTPTAWSQHHVGFATGQTSGTGIVTRHYTPARSSRLWPLSLVRRCRQRASTWAAASTASRPHVSHDSHGPAVTATLPITYVWQATGTGAHHRDRRAEQRPQPLMQVSGSKAVTVTATNTGGTVTRRPP